MRIASLIVLLLALPFGEALAALQLPKAQMRPCRNDTFFLDVPLQYGTLPWADATRVEAIRREIQRRARLADTEWFGADYARLRIKKTPVLPSRSGFAPRNDGHLRFWRFTIDDGGGVPVAAANEALCDIVANLRDSVTQVLGNDAGQVRVGRECDATAEQQFCNANGVCVDPPTWPSDEALEWHLHTLGLDPANVSYGRHPRYPASNIALIDTQIDPVVRNGLGVTESNFLPSPDVRHRHGTDMALFLRQVAREARLFSVPVLDEQGVGQLGNVAKGLDRALYLGSIAGDKPLVVNMSLGFPPEMALPSYITGNVNYFDPDPAARCVSTEDGAGESLRYMLDVARHLDGDPYRVRNMGAGAVAGPILVVAATGNRDGYAPGYRSDLIVPTDMHTYDNCGYDATGCPGCGLLPGRFFAHMFMPGNWSWIMSGRSSVDCRPNEAYPLTLAVAASDDQDFYGPSWPVDTLSFLLAPGVNVFANGNPAWGVPAPAAPNCADPQHDSTYTLPYPVSGSSASSAFVSGLAAEAFRIHAQVQAERAAAGRALLPALNRRNVAELLYLTGEPTPNLLFGSATAARRVHWGRLDAALRCGTADAILSALHATDVPMKLLIDGAAVSAAIPALEACGIPFSPPLPALTPVSWPPAYSAPTCSAVADTSPGFAACDSLGVCLPYGPELIERYGAGSLGPSPSSPVCPDCGVRLRTNISGYVASMDLSARINSTLPTTTEFRNPKIVVRTKVTPISEYTSALTTVTPAMLKPGNAFSVNGITVSGITGASLTPSAFSTNYNVVFRVEYRTSSTSSWVLDSSALRISY